MARHRPIRLLRAAHIALVALAASCAGEVQPPRRTAPPVAPPAPPAVAQPPPLSADDLLRRAIDRRGAGDTAGARTDLDAAVAREPGLAAARLERADLLLSLGTEWEAAQADAREAARLTPSEARPWRVLGSVLEEAGRPGDAADAYSEAVSRAPDEELTRRVASLEARAGRADAARARWEAIRDAHPDDAGAHVELAGLYEGAGRFADAEREYRALLAVAPENPAIRRRFADFLDARGRRAEAAAERRKAGDSSAAPRRLRPLPPSSR